MKKRRVQDCKESRLEAGGIHERSVSGLEGYRKGGIQKRGLQDRRDTGDIVDRRDKEKM